MDKPGRIDLKVTTKTPPPLTFVLQKDIPAGSFLRIRAGGVTTLNQIKVDHVFVTDGSAESKQEIPVIYRFRREDMMVDWNWYQTALPTAVLKVAEDLKAGMHLDVRISYAPPRAREAQSVTSTPMGSVYSDMEWQMSLGMIPAVDSLDFDPVAVPLILYYIAGKPHHLETYLKPDGRLLVEQFDRLGNPAESDGAGLRVAVGDYSAQLPPSPGIPATVFQLPENLDRQRVDVIDSKGRKAITNAPPYALDGTPTYFGEFHWHCEISNDGQRSLESALRSARDELGLDFAGPADHMDANGRYSPGPFLPSQQASICRSFDEPGRFCTLPSAELSRRYGHTNIVTDNFDSFLEMIERFENELLPEWEAIKDESYGLAALSALCPPEKGLVIPHHTNMDSFVREGVVKPDGRPYWCAMYWPLCQETQAVRLVEMVQSRGSFETEQPDSYWRVLDGGLGGSVRTALMRGYRLGFTGGTDNHNGWPTRMGKDYAGLTGVQVKQLDTASIFKALYERRCYATSGARIVADATLNGFPIGSELKMPPGSSRQFHIRIQGTAPLTDVQVIHSGYVLAALPVEKDSQDFDGFWEDDRPGRPLEDAWYYIRARQMDGHCVWLSPFWVDLDRS